MTDRRLAAILVADVVGYSKLVGSDEARTLAQLHALRTEIIEPQLAKHSGRLFKAMGDGFLIEFASAVQAVSCAKSIQEANALGRLPVRIGIHVGDVVVQGDDLLGDGVNIAARIESIADPGGIAISRAVHEQVRDKLDLGYMDKGEVALKNIVRPVHVFTIGGTRGAKSPAGLALPDKPSIAVLPFQNLSADAEQELFTDGIVEDIIIELSRFRELFVIARNSSFAYKGRTVDIKQIGRELGVRYVLEGSIRRFGNRIRITAQLIEAETGSHLWAERYDRVLQDIFEVQEEVTHAIVSALAPEIAVTEQSRALRRRPEDVGAYEVALRAWADTLDAHQTGDPALMERAVQGARKALAIDPNSILAWQSLCFARQLEVWHQFAADLGEGYREAIEAADRAIALDGANARSHALRAYCCFAARDYEPQPNALLGARRAHEMNVNDTFVLWLLANLEGSVGDAQRAIDHCQQILRLNPRDSRLHMIYTLLAFTCFGAKRYAEGAAWAARTLNDAPRNPPGHSNLINCLVGLGEIDKAKAAFARAQEMFPQLITRMMSGRSSHGRAEVRERGACFIRIAAGLEPPSAAEKYR
jgi:adenylate cyclase